MDKKKIAIILAVIFLIQLVQFVIWIEKDTVPPASDQAWHAMISLNAFNQLLPGTLTTSQAERIYPIFKFANNYYPPFYHISAIPFYLVFGTCHDSALMSNLLFLAILILSSFFIGKKIHSENAGLLMAFIASTIPIYSYLMRDYMIDFALSSMVSLGIALLLYTDNFENLKYSIFFGAVLGLGMLTKWTYIVYLAVPLCISTFIFVKKSITKKKYRRIGNILIVFLIAFIIAALWYLPHFKSLIPNLIGYGGLARNSSLISLANLSYYLLAIMKEYSFFYFILFIAGTAFCIFKKEGKKYLPYLASVILVYAVFTYTSNKDPRYIAPIYAFLAPLSVLGAYWIKDIARNKKIGLAIIIFVIAFGLFQNIAYNSSTINLQYNVGNIALFDSIGKYPSSSQVSIEEVLSKINDSADGRAFSVCIISENGDLNDRNAPYFSMLKNYPVSIMMGNGCNPLNFDYSISGLIAGGWRDDLFKNSKLTLEKNIDGFEEIYSANNITVYKRIK